MQTGHEPNGAKDGYSVRLSKVSKETIGDSYKLSSNQDSFELLKTDESTTQERLEVLIRMGVDPSVKNEVGMTARDVVEVYCPGFAEIYDKVVPGQKAEEHQDL